MREGFMDTKISEGFCKELIFINEMLVGEVKIDGHFGTPLLIGD